MRDLSIVLTMCGFEPDKALNLMEVFRVVKSQDYDPAPEIILVEQASRPYPAWQQFCQLHQAKHVFIGDHEKYPLYRRGWMKNVGVRQAKNDLVLILNEDVVFGIDYMSRFVEAFQSKVMNGWDKVICLKRKASDWYMVQHQYRTDWLQEDIQKILRVEDMSAWGSGVLFERDFYLNALGGENEAYAGWGFRDRDLRRRCTALTGTDDCLEYSVLHLAHGREESALSNVDNSRPLLTVAFEHPVELSNMLARADFGRTDHPTEVDWGSL